jgi:hypothetical protein
MNSMLREFIGDNPALHPLVRKLFVYKGTMAHPRQLLAAPRMCRTWNVLTQLLALTILNPQLKRHWSRMRHQHILRVATDLTAYLMRPEDQVRITHFERNFSNSNP